jgi:hypothetical protein
MDDIFLQPSIIRLGLGHLLFNFFIADDAALVGIDEEHAAGLKTPFFRYSFCRHIQDPNLRSHDDEIILRDVVSGWTQTVAVEHCTDHGAVGERDRGWAVPGLH